VRLVGGWVSGRPALYHRQCRAVNLDAGMHPYADDIERVTEAIRRRSYQGSVAKRRARFLGATDALLGFSTRATICLRAPTSICSALMP